MDDSIDGLPAGGWTRVLVDDPLSAPVARYLGIETGSPVAVAFGQAGHTGPLFAPAMYDRVAIGWGPQANESTYDWLSFATGGADLFANVFQPSIALSTVVTTDAVLDAIVDDAGGAVFCQPSVAPHARPGGSSWGIVAQTDVGRECGCHSTGGGGGGAFYGGHSDPNDGYCAGTGGNWGAASPDGAAKGNVTSQHMTMYIGGGIEAVVDVSASPEALPGGTVMLVGYATRPPSPLSRPSCSLTHCPAPLRVTAATPPTGAPRRRRRCAR